MGKRRKELSGTETDVNNGDKARIGGNLTPNRRKKTKLLKICPAESLQPDSNVQLYKEGIRINIFDEESKKKSGGGSLDMLMDAIQLVEDQRTKRNLGLTCLVPVLFENIKEGKNSMGRPDFQNPQFWDNGGLVSAEELALDRQNRDGQCIPKTVDMDGEAVPQTRSKRGWLPTLPSKYSDSVLQPWKKATRKVPKY